MIPTTVLLVDDNATFRRITLQFLAAHKDLMVVGAASCGDQALDLAPNLRPDVVLIDLAMPGLPGLETIPQLRALLPDARIITLTLMDTPSFRQAALDAGADAFVSKPTMRFELIPTIQRLVAAGARLPVAPPATKRVLVLGDNAALSSLYLRALHKQGYVVRTAGAAAEAAVLLAQQRFDVLICDLHFNEVDETATLREHAAVLFRPGAYQTIVVGPAAWRAECESLGADFFMERPVSLEALLGLLARFDATPHKVEPE